MLGTDIHQATPYYLQECIVEDLKEMLDGRLFRNPGGTEETYIPMQVYEQNLPIPVTETEALETDEIDYDDSMYTDPVYNCPWALVKLDSGAIPGPNQKQRVVVAICFGLYNPDAENNGHKELLVLFNEIMRRYINNPILARAFRCTLEFDWSIQREDTYPYFFGAVSTSFEMHAARLESEYT